MDKRTKKELKIYEIFWLGDLNTHRFCFEQSKLTKGYCGEVK